MRFQDEAPGHKRTDHALAVVHAWRAEILAHPALQSLRAFNRRMADAGDLAPAAAHAFVASLYAFNRSTPAGIAHLAARWADHLALTDPLSAHRIASSIMAAAVDEFGLAGTRPHLELFMTFAARWQLPPASVMDASRAVPAALELGERVHAWYRTAPLAVSLAVHFVSEETSAEEFAGWYPVFPDQDYTRVHAQLEPGHSSDAGDALALHLAAHPEDTTAAQQAIAPYLTLYRAMWDELAQTLTPPA